MVVITHHGQQGKTNDHKMLRKIGILHRHEYELGSSVPQPLVATIN